MILAAVAAFWIKTGAVDTVAMATGKTPPSHAYRMAKLRERQAQEKRRRASDPDIRGGMKMVARHWYLDACEDVDHWRAHRHKTRPERQAAKAARSRDRQRTIKDWAYRNMPGDPEPTEPAAPDEDGFVDAEIVDETVEFDPAASSSATATEEEPAPPAPGTDITLLTPDESSEQTPLPYRRLVLMTMLSAAGYAPDTDAIGRMTSEEVDGAIAALLAHERARRAAAH